jgi:integrase/recombinase XerC
MLYESRNNSGERALSEKQVAAVIAASHTTQDKLLMEIGFSLGLRRDDLVALKVVNVKTDEGVITYEEKKKKNRIRSVPTQPTLTGELKRYIATLPKNQVYLFPAREKRTKEGHLSSRTAYKIFNDLCAECGIKTPIPIHSMRASAAKILKNKGWTIEQVANLLGDRVETVQHYYTVPSESEMRELMGKGGVI